MSLPSDVCWLIIKEYMKINYDANNILTSDINSALRTNDFTNIEKIGSFLSRDLILFRRINKNFKKAVEKYTTLRKHHLMKHKILYFNYPIRLKENSKK